MRVRLSHLLPLILTFGGFLTASESHWSFRPLKNVTVPAQVQTGWARTAIDGFILAKLDHEQLSPQPQADRYTLLRRVSAGLTGLPPTPDQIHAFVHDAQPDAYERMVNRHLNDPQYGVRWARHWLDVARFGESDGILNVNGDKIRKNAWRYRDAVVNAFNMDLPFDQFVRAQLYGPLVENNRDLEALRRFAHLGTHLQDNDNPNDRQFHRLDDMVATTGSAFLGLTFGCARCHDHPVDPMSAKEYYQFTAFFFDQFDELPMSGKRPVDLVIKEPRVLHKGSWSTPGEPVDPGFLQALMNKPASHWRKEGRADLEALGAWMTDTGHGAGMQLARVIVNRLWHHHFGRGLVKTPNDFGKLGGRPSHPELLDWLAARLIDHDWRIKSLQRLILNSAVYRQGAASDDRAVAHDAENKWLWQRRPQRIDAETIRDRLLIVSGRLKTEIGGPSIPIGNYKSSLPEHPDRFRRSIYLQVNRTAKQATLSLFDPPNNEKSFGARSTGSSPDSALFALNSPFSWNLAHHFSKRVQAAAGEAEEKQIRHCYLLALSRPPTAEEVSIGRELLRIGSLLEYCHIILALNEFIYIQ
mgnify:CR=1 FL=1